MCGLLEKLISCVLAVVLGLMAVVPVPAQPLVQSAYADEGAEDVGDDGQSNYSSDSGVPDSVVDSSNVVSTVDLVESSSDQQASSVDFYSVEATESEELATSSDSGLSTASTKTITSIESAFWYLFLAVCELISNIAITVGVDFNVNTFLSDTLGVEIGDLTDYSELFYNPSSWSDYAYDYYSSSNYYDSFMASWPPVFALYALIDPDVAETMGYDSSLLYMIEDLVGHASSVASRAANIEGYIYTIRTQTVNYLSNLSQLSGFQSLFDDLVEYVYEIRNYEKSSNSLIDDGFEDVLSYLSVTDSDSLTGYETVAEMLSGSSSVLSKIYKSVSSSESYLQDLIEAVSSLSFDVDYSGIEDLLKSSSGNSIYSLVYSVFGYVEAAAGYLDLIYGSVADFYSEYEYSTVFELLYAIYEEGFTVDVDYSAFDYSDVLSEISGLLQSSSGVSIYSRVNSILDYVSSANDYLDLIYFSVSDYFGDYALGEYSTVFELLYAIYEEGFTVEADFSVPDDVYEWFEDFRDLLIYICDALYVDGISDIISSLNTSETGIALAYYEEAFDDSGVQYEPESYETLDLILDALTANGTELGVSIFEMLENIYEELDSESVYSSWLDDFLASALGGLINTASAVDELTEVLSDRVPFVWLLAIARLFSMLDTDAVSPQFDLTLPTSLSGDTATISLDFDVIYDWVVLWRVVVYILFVAGLVAATKEYFFGRD